MHVKSMKHLPICLAIHGCSSLILVSDFIKSHPVHMDALGQTFTANQLAGQYAFEQVKLDRKGYDSRRIQKILNLLSSAGVEFDMEEALSHADELINYYTADFGHDEDGEATFRIKSQSFRLKKYDCCALWDQVLQATLSVDNVSQGTYERPDEEDEGVETEMIMDFTVTISLSDINGEKFAFVSRYITADNGQLYIEDLLDFRFTDYPNFHDESNTMQHMLRLKVRDLDNQCLQAVSDYLKNFALLGQGVDIKAPAAVEQAPAKDAGRSAPEENLAWIHGRSYNTLATE